MLNPELAQPEPGSPIQAHASPESEYRWQGHDFVYCFISDDGVECNAEWASIAQENNFRFTIAVNASKIGNDHRLDAMELEQLRSEGFEIANHTNSHAETGMTPCWLVPLPPICDSFYGDLRGYFDTEGSFPVAGTGIPLFEAEIDRGILAGLPGFSRADIVTLAYPRHSLNQAIVDALVEDGYIGARGSGLNYRHYSDFSSPPADTWDGGMTSEELLWMVELVQANGGVS